MDLQASPDLAADRAWTMHALAAVERDRARLATALDLLHAGAGPAPGGRVRARRGLGALPARPAGPAHGRRTARGGGTPRGPRSVRPYPRPPRRGLGPDPAGPGPPGRRRPVLRRGRTAPGDLPSPRQRGRARRGVDGVLPGPGAGGVGQPGPGGAGTGAFAHDVLPHPGRVRPGVRPPPLGPRHARPAGGPDGLAAQLRLRPPAPGGRPGGLPAHRRRPRRGVDVPGAGGGRRGQRPYAVGPLAVRRGGEPVRLVRRPARARTGPASCAAPCSRTPPRAAPRSAQPWPRRS